MNRLGRVLCFLTIHKWWFRTTRENEAEYVCVRCGKKGYIDPVGLF